MIPIDTITVLRAADHTGNGLLFVPLRKVCVHRTNAGQETLLVVIGPRLHPFGEQLDAALEQAERATVFFAQALHDGQQAVYSDADGAKPVDHHRQEVAAFHFAPLAKPLQHVTNLRHDCWSVCVSVCVGHYHGRRSVFERVFYENQILFSGEHLLKVKTANEVGQS